MKFLTLLTLLIGHSFQLFGQSFAQTDSISLPCQWPADQRLTMSRHGSVFVLPDSPNLHAPGTPNTRAFLNMRQWVESHVEPDSRALLMRQQAIYVRGAPRFPYLRNALPIFEGILEGRIGNLSPISCLEALLLNEHTTRSPLETTGTEFIALALKRSGFLKIYYASGDIYGSGPSLHAFNQAIREDLLAGWKTEFHLHNHPFLFTDRGSDIAGTPIPSDVDIRMYDRMKVNLDLQEARVTNGFDTLRIPAHQFALLLEKLIY